MIGKRKRKSLEGGPEELPRILVSLPGSRISRVSAQPRGPRDRLLSSAAPSSTAPAGGRRCDAICAQIHDDDAVGLKAVREHS
jgi:hypothetical protein